MILGMGNNRVLLVDDDPGILKLFARILGSAKYGVETVDSGEAALEFLQNNPVDLVILDLDMPPPDGFEVLRALRTDRPELKVLVISGYVDGSVLKASELFGAAASLSKRDAPRELLNEVNQLLGRTATAWGFLRASRQSSYL